jgi:type III pantothenate kinase
MILLLDRGNSSLKWALASTEDWNSGVVDDVSEIPIDIAPQRVLISCVAGEAVTEKLCDHINQKWSLTPELVSVRAKAYGVTNSYVDCSQMGVDRWLAIIAAHQHYPQGALVVDVGTALTIDTVDASGQMQGGAIFPGPGLMLSSLQQGTAEIDLGEMQLFDVGSGIEDSTKKSVTAGVSQGFVGAVDRLVSMYRQRLSADAVILVTGGWAKPVLANITQAMNHESDLVLKGLAVIANTGDK